MLFRAQEARDWRHAWYTTLGERCVQALEGAADGTKT